MISSISFLLAVIMTNNILQWNCHSIKANFEEFTPLVKEQKPVAVCLQETFLKVYTQVSLLLLQKL